jgi:hypothetical protein
MKVFYETLQECLDSYGWPHELYDELCGWLEQYHYASDRVKLVLRLVRNIKEEDGKAFGELAKELEQLLHIPVA